MFDMKEWVQTGLNLLNSDNVNSPTSPPLHFELWLATSAARFFFRNEEKLIELVCKCGDLHEMSNKKYNDSVREKNCGDK
jgi:hypothetical protein